MIIEKLNFDQSKILIIWIQLGIKLTQNQCGQLIEKSDPRCQSSYHWQMYLSLNQSNIVLQVAIGDVFNMNECIDIHDVTKGHGMQGVVKRVDVQT